MTTKLTKADYVAAGRAAFASKTAGPKSGWQLAAWKQGYEEARSASFVVYRPARVYRDAERRMKATLARIAHRKLMLSLSQPRERRNRWSLQPSPSIRSAE